MIGAYIIRHSSGGFYIGQSTDIDQRRRLHLSQLNNNQHHSNRLQVEFNNEPNLSWEIFETASKEDAIALERDLLVRYKGDPMLFNTHGNIPEKVKTVRERRKAAARPVDWINPLIGRKQSVETINRRVKSLTGQTRSDAVKIHMSEVHKSSPACTAHMAKLHALAKKKVCVNGTVYSSVKDAASSIGIHSATVIQRIKSTSPNFQGWSYY